jgi:hypothetical protein
MVSVEAAGADPDMREAADAGAAATSSTRFPAPRSARSRNGA